MEYMVCYLVENTSALPNIPLHVEQPYDTEASYFKSAAFYRMTPQHKAKLRAGQMKFHPLDIMERG